MVLNVWSVVKVNKLFATVLKKRGGKTAH